MAVAIFTVFLVGFILGGSTVYLVENHFRTKEMNKIYKLTESLINGNDLDDSDIGEGNALFLKNGQSVNPFTGNVRRKKKRGRKKSI